MIIGLQGKPQRSKETYVRLGAINLIRSSRESIRIAQAAEAAGFWGWGWATRCPSCTRTCT